MFRPFHIACGLHPWSYYHSRCALLNYEAKILHICISSLSKLSNDSTCHTRPGLLKRVNGFAIIFMLKSSTSDIKIVPALLCLRGLYSLFHIGEAESLLEVMTASKQSAELF